MGKFSDLILVSDFDQTMTNYESQIPQSNLDAVQYFMEEGGIFTLATGRSLPMSRYRFLDVPVNAPLIVCNGAACYDPVTEELLFCHPLPDDCMALMRHYEKTFPHLRLEIHCLDKHYIFHHDKDRDAYLEQQKAAYAYVPWEEYEKKISPGIGWWWHFYAHMCPDISKARDLLGYEPMYTPEEALTRAVDWMRDNGLL